MKRSKTSAAWMQEHVSDPFVKRAKAEGFRSRAAFKLLELDEKDHLIRRGMRVVDLGAAPGGWSQVLADKVGEHGVVVALDLLEMHPVPGVSFIQGDFREVDALRSLEDHLGGKTIDLVVSDMAPNISGIASADQARAVGLGELALEFAREWLKPGGALVVKSFHGAGLDDLKRAMSRVFGQVLVRKPQSSRDRSSEIFLVCKGNIQDRCGPG